MIRTASICIALAVTVAGCASTPAEYAGALSTQDPKWRSGQCRQARAAAANYQERKLYWSAGALLGPYGLGLVAAGKDHQQKQRRKFAREIHLKCSSQPLPRELEVRSPG